MRKHHSPHRPSVFWISPLRRWFSRGPAAPTVNRPLRLETLEDRCLLAAGSVPDLIIQLKPTGISALPQVQKMAAADGLSLVPTVNANQYRAQGTSAVLDQFAASLAAQPSVQFTQREQTVSIAAVPNDPNYTNGNQWDLNGTFGINAPTAWNTTTGSMTMVVADTDTGIDYDHPDLYLNIWVNQAAIPNFWFTQPVGGVYTQKVWKSQALQQSQGSPLDKYVTDADGDGLLTFRDFNAPVNAGLIWDNNGDGRVDAGDLLRPINQGGWDSSVNAQGQDTNLSDAFFGWDYSNNDNDPFDDHSHGTHTAGTIGAITNNGVGIAGIDWQVQIMAVKMLDANGNGTDTQAAAAITFAANNGAKVANASWGDSTFSPNVYNAIQAAQSKGMVFVAAAGNSGSNGDVSPNYPAGMTITRVVNQTTWPGLANIVSVAATDSSGQLASFSTYGVQSVDLGEPGVSTLSTIPVNMGSYGFKSGTSMATPHVTGTVALVMTQYPSLSWQQVINKVLNSTTYDSALAGNTLTAGLLNASAALAAGPDIEVLDGAAFIPHSHGSVNYGAFLIGATPASHTFTVTNAGTQTLTVGTPSVPAGFTLTQAPGGTLTPGQSTTFIVQLNTAAAGSFNGTISLATNDPNDNPFSFTVSGTVGSSVVLDNSGSSSQFSETGSGWTHYTSSNGYAGNFDAAAAGNGSNTATWQLTGVSAGAYDVQLTWYAFSNRASNAPFAVYDGNTLVGTVMVNQQNAPVGGAVVNGFTFQSLGQFTINSGTLRVVTSDNANGYVIADALDIINVPAAPNILVQVAGTTVSNGGSVNYGSALIGSPVTHTFIVTDTGTQTLTLGTPSVPAGFALTQAPAGTVAPGQSTSFSVQLTAAAVGSYSGSVSFATNVSGANPFAFTVSGTVGSSVVIDNSSGSPGFTETGGGWSHYSSSNGYAGNFDAAAPGSGGNTATWTQSGLPAGAYDVQLTWYAFSNRASNAPFTVYDNNTPLGTVSVNQQSAPAGGVMLNGFTFQSIGHFVVNSGTLRVVTSDNANGYVIADALYINGVPAAPNIQVQDNGTTVSNGGSVNYGSALVGSPVTHTFTVTDTGTQTLTLGTPSVPAGFSLTQAPAGTVAPGQSTNFSVQMTAATAGNYSGSVSFSTNVSGANPFAFTVSGTVSSNILIDNSSGAPGFTETGGGWIHYSSSNGFAGNFDAAAPGSGGNTATWTQTGLAAGAYDMQLTWYAFSNRASNAPFTVYDGNTPLGMVSVNQQNAPTGGAVVSGFTFQSIGHFAVNSGTLRVVTSDNANGYVIADALYIIPLAAAPNILVQDNGTTVSNGGSVNYGGTLVGSPITHTFTVTDTGTQSLTLGTPSVPAGFSLTQAPAGTVTPGQSTTFSVQMTAAAAGSYSGSVSFSTNVSGSNPFSFTVSGTVGSSVVIDNSSGTPGFTETGGGWTHYSSSNGYGGNFDAAAPGSGGNTATWQATGLAAGAYDVQLTWYAFSNRASNAPFAVYDGNTLLGNVTVNQQNAPASGTTVNGFTFQSLGHFAINSGTLRVVTSDNANGYVIADALYINPLPAGPNILVQDNGTTVPASGSVNYGSALVGSPVSHTFTVTDTGTQTLTLGTPSVPAGFTLTQAPSGTVAPGQSTTFSVQMTAISAGNYSGSVSFSTNVSGANPFTFTVSGTVGSFVVIDNSSGSPGFSETGGGWIHYSSSNGYAGNFDAAAPGGGGNTATWTQTGLAAGNYGVQLTWFAFSNRASNASFSVYDGNTLLGTVTVNQQNAPTGGAVVNGFTFQSLGTFAINSGTLRVVTSDNANGYVIADALYIIPQ